MSRWTQYAIVAAILAWGGTAGAWLRSYYPDTTVAGRSELILVGHLETSSIKYVPHENTGGRGASWEYQAKLVVTEVLKGSLKEQVISIIINYGLEPQVGGRVLRSNDSIGAGSTNSFSPKDRVDIADTGDIGGTVLEDAQKDNVWFLRHLGGGLGREEGKGAFGIVDPEDVAALKFKDYFKALLSKDVEEQINRLLADPDETIIARTLRHLSAQHRPQDVPRIAKLLSSPNDKVQTAAASALAEVADVSAVPLFRKTLEHDNPEAQATACNFLCRFRDTESISAIGKVLPHFDAWQRGRVIPNLPQMESRDVVELLLNQLDEQLDSKTGSSMSAYQASVAAASALRTLTGVEFPLDTAQARQLWDKLKSFPDVVLLRKSILEDIEALTTEANYDARWNAYETLGRTVNQHFGSYDAFHSREAPGREESQELWRSWDRENITRTRVEWIYDGFARSGIVLPRPMDTHGVDLLIQVLEFYGDWLHQGRATSGPNWNVEGGWVKANFHRYNANWLLERVTGYKAGSPQDGELSQRWAAWWKENRGNVKILALPEEEPVTAQILAKVPSLRLQSPPLSLTIRPKNEAQAIQGHDPLTSLVEIKNVSSQDVLLTQRPFELRFTRSGGGGAGACQDLARAGTERQDYVTLVPGQTIRWEEARATSRSVKDIQYELTYCFAGSQFGLHAWRGKLLSNLASWTVEAAK